MLIWFMLSSLWLTSRLTLHVLQAAKIALSILALLVLQSSTNQNFGLRLHPALVKLPNQIVWAWQRPEDLRWLPANVGVAYVETSITLEKNHVYLQPRQHSLMVRHENAIIPVVHVDASWRQPPDLSLAQQKVIVDALVLAAQRGNSHVVQLDFEVRRSQRAFLAGVVKKARLRLPKDTALSMTALASWCAGDHWMGKIHGS